MKIEIPAVLERIADGRASIEVSGNTVRECLDDLIRQFPTAREWFDEENPIVWVALNQNVVGLTSMDSEVTQNDKLSLVLLIGGG